MIPFLQTPLAQRVRGDVSVSNAFPRSAVFLVDVRCALKAVVLVPHSFPMFFAVGAVRELAAAGIEAGMFRSMGNGDHLFIFSCFPGRYFVK